MLAGVNFWGVVSLSGANFPAADDSEPSSNTPQQEHGEQNKAFA